MSVSNSTNPKLQYRRLRPQPTIFAERSPLFADHFVYRWPSCTGFGAAIDARLAKPQVVRSLTAILQATCVDQRREGRRLLPSTPIVKKIASERRTPIFQHTHEGATRDLRRDVLFKGKRQTQPIDGGANHEIRVVDDQGSADIDDEVRVTAPVPDPTQGNAHARGQPRKF
jgi:hypothetical protein